VGGISSFHPGVLTNLFLAAEQRAAVAHGATVDNRP